MEHVKRLAICSAKTSEGSHASQARGRHDVWPSKSEPNPPTRALLCRIERGETSVIMDSNSGDSSSGKVGLRPTSSSP